jgi:hypothetical protein
MPSVYQGDSLWLDYELSNFRQIDSTWGNWEGTFEISTTESATPSVTGNLVPSANGGVFYLRLGTDNSSWNALAAGTYKLFAQFVNTTAKYREEKHDVLTVKTQGT